ncbi:MAG: magnesium/cobalt transporter CorA [Thermodesulfobacteriota bacterium]
MRFISRTSKKAGISPGTLVHIGEKRTDEVRITLIEYNQVDLSEKTIKDVSELSPDLKNDQTVTWLNIDGLHDVSLMEAVGRTFGIHPLVLEDIMNTSQRPKVDDFEGYVFITLKMFYLNEDNTVETEQASIILGRNYVLSFSENIRDSLTIIKERLRSGKGKIRSGGADYLAYALLDTIVDHYFIVLDYYNETIESLEEETIERPRPDTLQAIHTAKREMIFFHRHIWPLREILGQMKRGDLPNIQSATQIYLADVYDHLTQVIETTEAFRDILSGLQELYLSAISHKMNEIMKVLTIIATIFIPLTFIAGVYGMNFDYMPELRWRWGYAAVWGIMITVAGGLLIYFKRKRWM